MPITVAKAALVALDLLVGGSPGRTRIDDALWRLEIAHSAEDWTGVLAEASKLPQLRADRRGTDDEFSATLDPKVAYAKARLGDMPGAQALIATTPTDSYDALIGRAKIAAVAKDWSGVDRWFGEAVRQNPSIPFAYAGWGETLLAKGDPDRAIAKLKLANEHGPRFADPLEIWGEALLAKGDAKGAARKFAAAAKFAPRWGRLHLKWGEALAKLGKTDEARAKWRAAATMDLSASDRAALKSHGV